MPSLADSLFRTSATPSLRTSPRTAPSPSTTTSTSPSTLLSLSLRQRRRSIRIRISSSQPSSLDLPLDALPGQLLELGQPAPPMHARIVATDAIEEFGRLGADVAVAVEEAEGEVEEPRVGLGGYRQQQANLVVRVHVPVEGQVDLAARGRRQTLGSEAVVHVVQIESFEGSDLVELG